MTSVTQVLKRAIPLLERFRDWFRSKPERRTWRAEAEFDYYCAQVDRLAAHRRRQKAWLAERHYAGQRMLRNLGIFRSDQIDGKRILDVGAGEACVSQALALIYRPDVVVAVDALPAQIWAPAVYGVKERIEYVVASALDLPYEDESFDIVVAHLVVHHFPDKITLFREIERVLAPGGEFRCFEPNALPDTLLSLVGRGHAESDNEAPVWPAKLRREMTAVFEDVEDTFYWNRMDTSRLGPFSPGIRLVARKKGHARSGARVKLRRTLSTTHIPNLRMDSALGFAKRAKEQIMHIAEAAGPF